MSSTPKQRNIKHLKFTYYEASLSTPPKIVLNYTAPVNPVPFEAAPSPNSRVTFTTGNKKGTTKQQAQPAIPKKQPTGLARVLIDIHKKVLQRDTQKIFAYPVTEDIAPGYFNIVKHPMDLSTIKTKIHNDEYQTIQQFRDDMRLMFTNCLTYNPKTTYVYQQGEALFQFFRRHMKIAKKTLVGANQNLQQTLSSSSRTISEASTGPTRQSLDSFTFIPVIYETPPKGSSAHINVPQPPDGTVVPYYVPSKVSVENDGSKEKINTFCDVIRSTPKIQNYLRELKAKFPEYVVSDAVHQFAGVGSHYNINMSVVDSAINDQIGKPISGSIAVREAPTPCSYLDSLKTAIPNLPLETIRPRLDSTDAVRDENLRLMLFYNNCLQHWKGSDLMPGKQKILRKIKDNISKITLNLAPSALIKVSEHNILQHILYSIPTQ